MSARLSVLVTDYLEIRRALGFQLKGPERTLAGFLAYLNEQNTQSVTVEHALAFATDPGLSTRSQALRLSAIRCFARWAMTMDPAIQVPPANLLPARSSRAAPFIYTPEQISSLLQAAAALTPAIRAASMGILIGLMAATGMRTGETISLDISHWDRQHHTLNVTGKYAKTRILPVHATVGQALSDYLDLRAKLLPAGGCPALLIGVSGKRMRTTQAQQLFRGLVSDVGLAPVSNVCRPRLHDLRHTFAVNTMLDAYRGDQNPAAVLPVLSTWLGHADPSDTYWYLSGTAELLSAALTRLDHGEHAQCSQGDLS